MKRGFYSFIFLSLFSGVCLAVPSETFAPGELLVVMKRSVSTYEAQGVSGSSTSNMGMDPVSKTFPIRFCKLLRAFKSKASGKSSAGGYWYHVKLTPSSNLDTVINQWRQNPDVLYVQPNYRYLPCFVPNDPGVSEQWALDSLKLKEAWDLTTGNAAVRIAIIDSGADPNHPDLKTKFVAGRNAVNDTSDFSDLEGHGTHVTGIIGAAVNNAKGIAGVSYACRVMPIMSMENGGFYDSTLIKALQYAVDNGAQIINMSLGGASGSSDDLLGLAIKDAQEAGIIVVAAAGNSHTNIDMVPFYPACYDQVIAVSAQKSTGAFDATYSNYGNRIDLMAPGTSVLSTYTPEGSEDSQSGAYAYLTGTSMASPAVAGVIGLLKSVEPTATYSDVYTALTQTATKPNGVTTRNVTAGYGVPNAFLAAKYIDRTPPSLRDFTAENSPLTAGVVKIITRVTDNINITPSSSVFYRFLNGQGVGVSNWVQQKLPALVSANYFGVTVAKLPTASSFVYYFKTQDHKGLTKYYPTGAPNQTYQVSTVDKIPPGISTTLRDGDAFSTSSVLRATVTDNVALVTASISIRLTSGTSVQFLTLSSPAVTFVQSVVSVALQSVTLTTANALEVRIQAQDVSGNEAEKTIHLVREQPPLDLLGPQGANQPILTFPNPFDPDKESTVVAFENTVPLDSLLISIYSLGLEVVRTYTPTGTWTAGYHEVAWNGRDDKGDKVPNGVYIGVIKAGTASGKMVAKQFKVAVLRR